MRYGDILLPELLKVLNQAFDTFRLPESMNEASFLVVPNPDKAHSLPESILLLNSDVKILAKVLATRLNNVIEKFIHPDQTGFIPGSSRTLNLRK